MKLLMDHIIYKFNYLILLKDLAIFIFLLKDFRQRKFFFKDQVIELKMKQ